MNTLSMFFFFLAMAEEVPDSQPASALVKNWVPVPLCAALEAIQPGDLLPVAVAGFYREAEGEGIFSPGSTSCRSGDEPQIRTEFAPGFELPADLRTFLEGEAKAAWVSFTGILVGGHEPLRAAKLIVEGVELAWFPAEEMRTRPPSPWQANRSPFPIVQRFSVLSHYPREAARLGVDGQVAVEVTLKSGNHVSLKVLSATSTLLVEDSLAQIRTWEFEKAAAATFTTTFIYRFEDLPSTTPAVQVHTELPIRVEVIAARNARKDF